MLTLEEIKAEIQAEVQAQAGAARVFCPLVILEEHGMSFVRMYSKGKTCTIPLKDYWKVTLDQVREKQEKLTLTGL